MGNNIQRGVAMKKIIIALCFCIAITGCLKGKKVVLTDTKTNTSVEVTEDGLIVSGTLPIGDGVELTVTEDAE